MSHKVIKDFRDKTDNLKRCKKGDSYSHDDDDRIAFLVEKGFLEESKQPPEDDKTDEEPKDDIKHVGGGYYKLPNGEKVKGKEEALAQLESGE